VSDILEVKPLPLHLGNWLYAMVVKAISSKT